MKNQSTEKPIVKDQGTFPQSIFPKEIFPGSIFPWMGNDDEAEEGQKDKEK